MTLLDTDDQIPNGLQVPAGPVACRLASEGIPVAAIARSLQRPSDQVMATLKAAVVSGDISAMPKFDWPPTGKLADHLPATFPARTEQATLFIARKTFRLTPLEASFLMVLLRCDNADKARLHTVIENQRFKRSSNPDRLELTDPKMVDVMICKLRKKLQLADETYKVETVWGSGYYIDPVVRDAILDRLNSPPNAENPNGQSVSE